jgi:nitrogen fixation protein FixH
MKKNFLQSDSKIPYIFIAFFAVIIVVNVVYIYLAKTTWRGVATEDAYQKGLNYNETLKQEEKQKELGWSVDTKINQTGKNKASILVVVLDKESNKIKDATVNIFFRNPAKEEQDFAATTQTFDNAYRFNVDFPQPGQWDAIFEITRGEDKLYVAKRYVVQ